jgi:hypothetical protein
MILPTKHLSEKRALLRIGAELLPFLDKPQTISQLWESLKQSHGTTPERSSLTYDWFILALDLLYITGAVEFERPYVRRAR